MRGGLTLQNPARDTALAVLGRRLTRSERAPVAVAVSGGGDSLALLHIAHGWAERAGRPLLVLTVDHRLQSAGAEWCAFVAERARRLGAAHRTLIWTGSKPATGLPAAARAARHALIAEAARAAGARVVLMGHTADDVAEALEMRRAGSSVPIPAEWAPSPVWPEGRGIFLLRPLLGARRAELRAMLDDLGERWIEDPANDDLRYGRAAARRRLADEKAEVFPPAAVTATLLDVIEGPAGDLSAPRSALSAPGGARLLGAMLLCAAGGQRPPRRASLERLLATIAAGDTLTATLAGARIEARGDEVTCVREAGRGGIAEVELPAGESVFDGRFLVTASHPGWRMRPLRGAAKRLPKDQRARLSALPTAARGALPVAISPAGDHCCPIVGQSGFVTARPVGLERLQGALGAFPDEAALWRVAKTRMGA